MYRVILRYPIRTVRVKRAGLRSDVLTTGGSEVKVGPAPGHAPYLIVPVRDLQFRMLSAGCRQGFLDSRRAMVYKNAHGTGKGIEARR